MPLVETDTLAPGPHPAQKSLYCGLDCCVTGEVLEALQTLTNGPPLVYDFERALQAPALEMMLRGFRIDETERRAGKERLTAALLRLDTILQRYAWAIWDKGLNPGSHQQLKAFFYGSMHLPEHWSSQKGSRVLSMNRETLEKLEAYFQATPIVAAILRTRDLVKQLQVLDSEVDSDGRMRTSFNIGGTETGRWSSSKSVTGTGMNLQNVQDLKVRRSEDTDELELRRMFVSDPGYKLAVIDLTQAEAYEVGYQLGTLFGDWTYLDGCMSGDLHTYNVRLAYRDWPWTGDLAKDRALAERSFYRHFSYRDAFKRLGHGTNYVGTAWTLSRLVHVPLPYVQQFQDTYFRVYPGIQRYHQWVASQIQSLKPLVTPFGRQRHFFGRPNDDATVREGVAFIPQSSTADRLNLALLRIWQRLGDRAQLLGNGFDSLTFQFREEDEGVLDEAMGLVSVPLACRPGRPFDVPGECKVGWNWGNYHEHFNPNGLKKWRGKGSDLRTRSGPLDRRL